MICNFDVKTSSPYGMADDLAACSTTEKISKSTPDVLSLAKFIISLSKKAHQSFRKTECETPNLFTVIYIIKNYKIFTLTILKLSGTSSVREYGTSEEKFVFEVIR